MGIIFAMLAILSESIGTTIDKLNFRKNRVLYRQLMFLIFFGMFISLALFIGLTGQPMPHLSFVALCLIAVIGIISFLGNVFDNLSLKINDLSLRQPVMGFESALAGLVGYLLFPEERKTSYVVAFVLAMFIVYWGTHQRRLRKAQKRGIACIFLAVALYALLPSIYKLTLDYVDPAYIAFFRVAIVLTLTMIFIPFKQRRLSASKIKYGLTAGVVYAAGTVFSLYALDALGVMTAMLLLLLSPALIYASGYFILKEKVRKGEIISSALLVIVTVATILT